MPSLPHQPVAFGLAAGSLAYDSQGVDDVDDEVNALFGIPAIDATD